MHPLPAISKGLLGKAWSQLPTEERSHRQTRAGTRTPYVLGSSASRFIGHEAPSRSAKAVQHGPSATAEPLSRETSHNHASTSTPKPPPIVLDGRAVADEWQVREAQTNFLEVDAQVQPIPAALSCLPHSIVTGHAGGSVSHPRKTWPTTSSLLCLHILALLFDISVPPCVPVDSSTPVGPVLDRVVSSDVVCRRRSSSSSHLPEQPIRACASRASQSFSSGISRWAALLSVVRTCRWPAGRRTRPATRA